MGGGFFCEFNKILSILIHFDDQNIVSLEPDWTDQFFPYKDAPHENGWDLYFESITQPSNNEFKAEKIIRQHGFHEIHDQRCTAPFVLYEQYLPYREYIHKIMNKYIRIKDHITQQVNDFYESKMQGHICIGVHVRYASAHAQEAPGGHPPLQSYMREVDQLLNQYQDKPTKIYIASDSHKVINIFKQRYKEKLIYIDAFRSSDKQDPSLIFDLTATYVREHPTEFHKKKPGYYGGLTTLLDGLLLAKCNYLIHITSNLAATVTFFNPDIKSIYLPRGLKAVCKAPPHTIIKNPYIQPTSVG